MIRKDGIKLRGDDAVIEAPPKAKADSHCSKVFGSVGICVVGDVDLETGKISGYVKDVSLSGFTVRGFDWSGIDVAGARDATVTKIRAVNNLDGINTGLSVGTKILSNVVRNSGDDGIGFEDSPNGTIAKNDVEGSSNAAVQIERVTNGTVVGNDLTGNRFIGISVDDATGTTILSNDVSRSEFAGVVVLNSPGTRILSNDVSRSDFAGAYVFGQKSVNAKLVGNHISGGPFGIYVEDAHEGSVVRKQSPRQLRGHGLRGLQRRTRGRLRGYGQHGQGQHALVSSRAIRQEFLGDRHRASRREWHGGQGQPSLGQRALRSHADLGRGGCLERPLLPGDEFRRDAEA